jgi:uncharacterized membrane protein
VESLLRKLHPEFPHEVLRIEVDENPALKKQYGRRLPVVEIGPYTLESPIEEVKLKVALGAARDAESRRPSEEKSPWGLRLNRGLSYFTRHWLAVFNLLVFLYAGLPFAAPALMKAGATGPARVIYTVYSPFCHQLAFRSWFLFGDQIAYPRELAGTSLEAFGQATGIGEEDYLEARRFLGNEEVGYKVALCERDIGIYGGILLAGILFSFARGRLKPLPLKFWLLLGIVPIALDGGSQLVSQLNVLPIAARESTPFLRSLTGALFGVINVWMAYPHVEETMRETRDSVAAKLAVAAQTSKASS